MNNYEHVLRFAAVDCDEQRPLSEYRSAAVTNPNRTRLLLFKQTVNQLPSGLTFIADIDFYSNMCFMANSRIQKTLHKKYIFLKSLTF